MQLARELSKALPKANARKCARTVAPPAGSTETIAEINAYIAIRDDLLAEAEQIRTRAKIDSLVVANDFVEKCLKPARPPYEGQCLPPGEAIRERKRCEVVKGRIAELYSQTDARSVRCASVR
jgi:hypothetical protein